MRFFFSKSKDNSTTSYDTMEPGYSMRCLVHSISETGPTRSHNEDTVQTYFLDDKQEALLSILADGMGGHNAGEIASRLACESVVDFMIKRQITNGGLVEALKNAHQKIVEVGNADASKKGMGTTATVVKIHKATLEFGHIGDSRLYQLRDGVLHQLSTDHTLVNDMYLRGEINKQERDTHNMKNVLTQALGTANSITPQTATLEIQIKDKYLLCSDGIYDVFSDVQLQDLMRMEDVIFMLECMRTLAYERRASDNFSAIIISFTDSPLESSPITKEQNIML